MHHHHPWRQRPALQNHTECRIHPIGKNEVKKMSSVLLSLALDCVCEAESSFISKCSEISRMPSIMGSGAVAAAAAAAFTFYYILQAI